MNSDDDQKDNSSKRIIKYQSSIDDINEYVENNINSTKELKCLNTFITI
jgi:hypothetical protein